MIHTATQQHTDAEHAAMMRGQYEPWVHFPLLPVKHRTRPDRGIPGLIATGLIVAGQGPVVYLANLYFDEITEATPREVYLSFDDVVAAGWIVD